MAKTAKAAQPAQVIIPAYVPFADAIVNPVLQAESLQVTIGKAVIAASKKVKPADIETFVGMVRYAMIAAKLQAASVKVECSRIRRVMLAMANGYKPKAGLTLRTMYEGAPKDPTKGGAPTGPRHGVEPEGGEPGEPEETPVTAGRIADIPDDERRVMLATAIWGYSEPGLIAALKYVETHAPDFIRWASDAATNAQVAEIERVVTKKPAVAKKATPAKKTRKAA